jgi:hypothetical protein
MSKKRGSRGSTKKCAVSLDVHDEVQMRRALDLSNVVGDKPTINSAMSRMMLRIEEEDRARMLRLAQSWVGGRSWSDSMIYDCMGEDDFPDDESLLGSMKSSRRLKLLNKKLFKRLNRDTKGKGKGRGKKRFELTDEQDEYWSNRHSLYPGEDFDNEDNYEESYKCIKFYDDIENELSVHEFNSLCDFNDFCQENGYHVGAVDYNNLVNNTVIHCCLDPLSKEYGENDVITDNSYGALYWSVSDDITKKTVQSLGSHVLNSID